MQGLINYMVEFRVVHILKNEYANLVAEWIGEKRHWR